MFDCSFSYERDTNISQQICQYSVAYNQKCPILFEKELIHLLNWKVSWVEIILIPSTESRIALS